MINRETNLRDYTLNLASTKLPVISLSIGLFRKMVSNSCSKPSRNSSSMYFAVKCERVLDYAIGAYVTLCYISKSISMELIFVSQTPSTSTCKLPYFSAISGIKILNSILCSHFITLG